MKTAIVTCATPNWIPWAAITLLSCVEFGKDLDSDLLLVSVGPSEEIKSQLKSFNAQWNVAIKLIEVAPSVVQHADGGKWGIGALLRLYLDRLLDPTYDRVLYLDCDALVLAPLSSIFRMNMRDCCVAAAPDVGFLPYMRPDRYLHISALGFSREGTYFNSGVMLFDWPQSNHHKLLPRALEILQTVENLRWFDQDALNLVLNDSWCHLNFRWNATGLLRAYCNIDPGIVHFTGPKPWSVDRKARDRVYSDYYRTKLANHPWSAKMATQKRLRAYVIDKYEQVRGVMLFNRKRRLEKYLSASMDS